MSKRGPMLLFGFPGLALLALAVAAETELPSPGSLVLPLTVILILVILNGFFVAAEFAIIGVRPTRIEKMADEGHKLAQKVLEVLGSRKNQDAYIATAQLGITVASLGLGMYAEPALEHFLTPYLESWLGLGESAIEAVSYVISLSFLTYLHIVVGEMVPKALALTNATEVVIRLSRPMQWAQSMLHWPVVILNAVGNFLLRLIGVPPAEGHERVLSPEEIELVVTESAEGGLLKEEEETLIRNIFDFGDRVVAQVMTPRTQVEAIPNDISYEALLQLVAESRHSRFPVFDGDRDHIVGMLHVKDLMKRAISQKGGFDLRLILRSVPAVPEDLPVETLLAAFKRQRLHMSIVLDEFGGMAGIVTLEDLVEEIVGEVRDEFDQEKEPYERLEPGVVEVTGGYLVDDLIEEVYLGEPANLPEVETVGGLIVTRLGRPPKVGDEVHYGDRIHMRVVAVDRRAVARVRIEYPVPEEGTSHGADGPETAD